MCHYFGYLLWCSRIFEYLLGYSRIFGCHFVFVKFDFFRDCSLFIGSTGPVFCGKDPWKKFLPRQQKFPKKLVSRQWKEGKKSMSRIITLYSHCVRGVICNGQRSLPLTAGGSGDAVSPPAGPGQGPGRGPEGEAPGSSEAPAFYRIRKSLKLILYF